MWIPTETRQTTTRSFACLQVRRLEEIVAASEQGLGSASNELASLKVAHEEKLGLLDQANAELRTLKARHDTLQVRAKLQVVHVRE